MVTPLGSVLCWLGTVVCAELWAQTDDDVLCVMGTESCQDLAFVFLALVVNSYGRQRGAHRVEVSFFPALARKA